MEKKHKVLITILIAVVIIETIALFLLGAFFGIRALADKVASRVPVYTSQTLLHVSNTTVVDAQSSQKLLDSCVDILNSRAVLDKVAEQSGLDYTADEIKDMISAEAISSTEILEISVTHTDPSEAQIIADTITKVAPDEFKRVIDGCAVSVIDYATYPTEPSGYISE